MLLFGSGIQYLTTYVAQECEFITVQQPIGLETFSDVINNTTQTYTMLQYCLVPEKTRLFMLEEVMDEMWESKQHFGHCSQLQLLM